MEATLMASQSPALTTYQDPDLMMLKGEFLMYSWFSDEATRDCQEWHAKLYPEHEAAPEHEDVIENVPSLADSNNSTPNTTAPATPPSSYEVTTGGLDRLIDASEVSAALRRKGFSQTSPDDLLFAHEFSQLDINGRKDWSKQTPIVFDRTHDEGPTGVVNFSHTGVDIESPYDASPIVKGDPRQLEFTVGLSVFVDYVNEIGPAVDKTNIPLGVFEQDHPAPSKWKDYDSDLLEAICNGIPEEDLESKVSGPWTYISWELWRN